MAESRTRTTKSVRQWTTFSSRRNLMPRERIPGQGLSLSRGGGPQGPNVRPSILIRAGMWSASGIVYPGGRLDGGGS